MPFPFTSQEQVRQLRVHRERELALWNRDKHLEFWYNHGVKRVHQLTLEIWELEFELDNAVALSGR